MIILPKILYACKIQLNYRNHAIITTLDYKLFFYTNHKGRILLKNALENKYMVFKCGFKDINHNF